MTVIKCRNGEILHDYMVLRLPWHGWLVSADVGLLMWYADWQELVVLDSFRKNRRKDRGWLEFHSLNDPGHKKRMLICSSGWGRDAANRPERVLIRPIVTNEQYAAMFAETEFLAKALRKPLMPEPIQRTRFSLGRHY